MTVVLGMIDSFRRLLVGGYDPARTARVGHIRHGLIPRARGTEFVQLRDRIEAEARAPDDRAVPGQRHRERSVDVPSFDESASNHDAFVLGGDISAV
jgi:hypothetical protein